MLFILHIRNVYEFNNIKRSFFKAPLKNHKSIRTLEENVFKSLCYVHMKNLKVGFYFKPVRKMRAKKKKKVFGIKIRKINESSATAIKSVLIPLVQCPP